MLEANMAQASQFTYTQKELVTLMIKDQGIHEGLWALLVNFGFGAMNAGATPDDLAPTAMVQVNGFGIQKALEKSGMTVDAAEVNPKP